MLMNRRVTLADVAAHAGVSRATASLVVRDAGNLADATRRRVRESMEALGYVYHRGAASLRASRTQSIGLIVPDMSNGFTAELTIGLEAVLAKTGRVTLTANSLEDPSHQDLLVRSMLERQVDGLLIIPAVGTDPEFAERLAAAGIPVVIATRDIPHPQVSYVGIDNVTGGRLAAEHLLLHGVERVAYLGGFAGLGPRLDRITGAMQALKSGGGSTRLEVDIPGPPRGSWGLEAAQHLIAERSLPDGIICHNDLVTFGVYRALRQSGVRNEIHTISYDDVAAASLWEPPLTTIAASGHEVGLRCAEVLLRRIADPGGPAERSLIASELVVRESCGCHPPSPTVSDPVFAAVSPT
jgi:LacI family transcriptional regulator